MIEAMHRPPTLQTARTIPVVKADGQYDSSTVCSPPGTRASSITPANRRSCNGVPSMEACQPGTSVRRRRSICGLLALVASLHDDGSG